MQMAPAAQGKTTYQYPSLWMPGPPITAIRAVAPPGGCRVWVACMRAYFAEQSFNEIHVESGATLNAALLEAGLVDELLMYFAPRVVGAGLPAANFAPSVQLDDLQQAGQWRWLDALILDDDVRLRLRKN